MIIKTDNKEWKLGDWFKCDNEYHYIIYDQEHETYRTIVHSGEHPYHVYIDRWDGVQYHTPRDLVDCCFIIKNKSVERFKEATLTLKEIG